MIFLAEKLRTLESKTQHCFSWYSIVSRFYYKSFLFFSTAVNLHCNFKTVGGVVVAVGAGVVLYKYSRGDSDIQQFANLFNEAILPAATNLCAIGNGSLCFTVQADNRTGLQLLWQQYRDGTLQENLQEFLVTKEIKQLASGENVIVTVHIDEQEFQDACLDLMMGDELQGKTKFKLNFRQIVSQRPEILVLS